ncbi:ribonuclease G [Natranaerovirga pectinivora]|uniref:Ribonuclease G n=1 Tax=Natranaerovirga pectinivora TaxID=682400 RepID=A0A4V6NZT7_9FIRM|nr:Rne/Rng family ribonuclease [Natranaerovirga pectinivora]TCT14921.1 ribonuclease G [Natranaerovirga pectinivora]
MSGKLVITKNSNRVITALMNNDNLIDLDYQDIDESQIIGNIYIGKVKNILKNINAAFVDIGREENAYLSLTENSGFIFLNSKNNDKINIGDEILVQVTKESTKTKGPVLTTHFSVTGRYMVLTYGKTYIGISNKIIDTKKKSTLKRLMKPYQSKEYGFIIRTNAQFVGEEDIIQEINDLIERYENIKKIAMYRSCYQIIEKSPSPFIASLRNYYNNELDRITVDDKEIYADIKGFLEQYNLNNIELQYYEDSNLSLFDLNSLGTKIEQAMKEKVWLKSGAYLVINPTEALVVIDVNTGKYSGKKNFEETVYKINMEAAKEIAKQIRLRNLSGIIIIDFIDMKKPEYRESLLQELNSYITDDPVKTTLIGMTPLNLVELTRKKIKKPIYEQFGKKCFTCNGRGYVWDTGE